MTQTILHIDSSARTDGSVTRDLSASIVKQLDGTVLRRDLAQALPHISETWIKANFTPAADRDSLQRDTLSISDALVAEIEAADVIVIGVPIYNFSIPTALKAWIDMICRAGLTFKYTENGPVGLMSNKRVILAFASGGTPIGSEIDFASNYLKHIMGFIGIADVEIIAADRVAADAETAIAAAKKQVAALAA
ncbi:MAG: NAD(P)H-dependent oxidoreductase [Rhodobacteraceae bacterium]|nr:NAD(P)H-dependent oxidoreductase [Paracoccaceae bacterium]